MKQSREMVVSMSIIAEVEQVCRERNISRAELSRMVYVTRGYITQVFRGDRALNLSFICRLEDALNINLISIIKQKPTT
jgi:transcriptional regulator with XRE-family HTH domain